MNNMNSICDKVFKKLHKKLHNDFVEIIDATKVSARCAAITLDINDINKLDDVDGSAIDKMVHLMFNALLSHYPEPNIYTMHDIKVYTETTDDPQYFKIVAELSISI